MIGVKTVGTKAAMSGLYHSGAHRLRPTPKEPA
jgi:hypothetical protein